jgi:hypothetical protein
VVTTVSSLSPLGNEPASKVNVIGPTLDVASRGISRIILSVTMFSLPAGVIQVIIGCP